MKTRILIIAAFICGGLIFTSCQKDNSLMEETSTTMAKDGPWSELNDPGDIHNPVSNYPDPFTNHTTISYKLDASAQVSLVVYNKDFELVIVLVNEYQEKGFHQAKLDATNLPVGQYIAELKTGSNVYREMMTKKSWIQREANSPVDIQ